MNSISIFNVEISAWIYAPVVYFLWVSILLLFKKILFNRIRRWVGKTKMIMQCVAVTASLLSLSGHVQSLFPDFNVLRDILLWTAVAVTVYSGVAYVQRALKMLKTEPGD